MVFIFDAGPEAGTDPGSFVLPTFLVMFSLDLSHLLDNNPVLEQVDKDAGSAFSLLIFSDLIFCLP